MIPVVALPAASSSSDGRSFSDGLAAQWGGCFRLGPRLVLWCFGIGSQQKFGGSSF